jgi:hypothetical protein
VQDRYCYWDLSEEDSTVSLLILLWCMICGPYILEILQTDVGLIRLSFCSFLCEILCCLSGRC